MSMTYRRPDSPVPVATASAPIDTDQSRASEVIGRIVDSTGLSVSEIAKRAGIAPSTLTRLYPSPSVKYTLSARTLRKLDEAFPNDGRHGLEGRPRRASSVAREDATPYAPPPRAPGIAIFRLGPSLTDTGLGHDGFELFDGDLEAPIGRWNGLTAPAGGEQLFVIYMPGDGMEPRIHAGEALLIDRLRPPALRSDVLAVVARADGGMAFCLGIMTGRDRDGVTLSQLRDQASATLAHGDIKALFRVAGRFDGAGI